MKKPTKQEHLDAIALLHAESDKRVKGLEDEVATLRMLSKAVCTEAGADRAVELGLVDSISRVLDRLKYEEAIRTCYASRWHTINGGR